jgi:hypothetical protein
LGFRVEGTGLTLSASARLVEVRFHKSWYLRPRVKGLGFRVKRLRFKVSGYRV